MDILFDIERFMPHGYWIPQLPNIFDDINEKVTP